MSEPAKKPMQNPESYTPKKPEIINLMDEAKGSIMRQERGVSEMEYRIEKTENFQIMGLSGYENEKTERDSEVTGLWVDFTANYDNRLMNHNGEMIYSAPYWQVGACNEKYVDGKMKMVIGAEYKGTMIDGMSLETIPAATYAVFSFPWPAGYSYCMEAYRKITEWFEASEYTLDEEAYRLEVYLIGGDHWELWMPVLSE